jgi:predicted nuclease of predicted toxin-antitoxin system
VHVSERGLLGKSDDAVLELARAENRALVSADTDFGELIALGRLVSPSVVLFRQGNRGPEHQAATLRSNLRVIEADLDAGAMVVFTDDRIRIRRLPLR